MKNIISYFIKYPVTGNVILILILVFGFFGLKSLRSTFFPEEPTKKVAIILTYPGASPEEIEEGVVAKVEDNLEGVTGIDRITSTSSENLGRVVVEMIKGYDIDVLLQDVKNGVESINSFPVDLEPPIVYKEESISLAISFSISGDVDLKTLKEEARRIEDDFLAVEGISKVELGGFPEEEIEIAVREDDLRRFSLTFNQVSQAVASANLDRTGGTIKTEQEELLIRTRSKEYYARELLDVVVATAPDGRKVLLSDVAAVQDRWADEPIRNYINRIPAVTVTINNTTTEDILFITDYVKAYLETYNESNTTFTATIIRDQSDVLNQRIDLLTNNGIIGFILVLVLLAMFLNIRLAFWVALAIPVSIMGMFIVGSFFDLSINVISLFGMILVIGILVDDGIVIGENIYQHYERGKDRVTAAIDGTMEVLPAVLAAITTTIAAFASFFYLDGRVGEVFSEMAFVVIVTLTVSLIEGAFILPGHVSEALKKARQKNPVEKALDKVMAYLRDQLYAPTLRFFMQNKALGLAIPIGLFAITIGAVKGGFIRTTFFPNLDTDFISINLKMPSGTREDITMKWVDHIESSIWEANEELKADRADGLDVIETVEKKLGPDGHVGSLNVIMLTGEIRNMENLTVADVIREKAGPIYEAEQVIYSSGNPFGKPISLSLRSPDLNELEVATSEVKAEMQGLSDLKDVVDTNQEGLRELNLKLKDKAYLLGLSLGEVSSQVRQGFFGAEVQRLQRGQDEVKVWVRYDEADRTSIGNLEEMRIRLANGQEFPLGEVAFIEEERGVMEIKRLEGQREIRLEADVASSDVSATDMIAEIRDSILPVVLEKHPDVRYSFEGQVRTTAKTQASSQVVMPILLIVMLAMITLTFRSIWQTVFLLPIIIFGFIGVGIGHYLMGLAISLLSFLGIVALVGIMVNDALVFVSAYNNFLKDGLSVKNAVYQSGVSRFRPIILTSITTIAGLAPLMLEKSFQAKFLIPMACSVAFGLMVATFLILLTLPVLLLMLNWLRVHLYWLWNGVKPTPEEVEPAVKAMRELEEARAGIKQTNHQTAKTT
ncbi:MAG: efflux RND transporter permease subunit [Bacteroidota bacterium]